MDPDGKQNREWRDLGGQLNRSGQLIDQFLEEELVGKWSEEKRNFLLKTAFLDSLCGPLCDAVTGLRDGREMLRGLWLQNEFLIALDNENYWYRYHPLFRDFLRTMFARQTDLSLSELYLKAACWCRENGLSDPALIIMWKRISSMLRSSSSVLGQVCCLRGESFPGSLHG
jgi:LuxR family maltose regulon positive regulatory protein